MKSHNKGYIKIEAEAKINKNGEIANWQDIPSQTPEYWSEAAMKESNQIIEYIKNSENEEKREELLKELGATALESATIEPNKYYPYGEITDYSKGTVVQGFKFKPYDPDIETKGELYLGVFPVECATIDETSDREKGLETTPMPKNFDNQKNVARFYIGALDYREQAEHVGKYQDVGLERYTPRDARKVEEYKRKFLYHDQGDDNVEDKIAGRMLEGFFYPLIKTGFFDSLDGTPAATIITSDYDDFVNKADTALFIDVKAKNKNGEIHYKKQPICFDLTIGHGIGKISKIRENFNKRHGFTDIIYPATCLKNNLPTMKDVPHFVLCLPRSKGEFTQFCESLAAGKRPPKEICDLINYEIYRQAEHWAEFYSKPETEEDKTRFQTYKRLAACFRDRFGDTETPVEDIELHKIEQNHKDATRFITGLPQRN
ncbi:hypothetical protein IKF23_02290 [Candidatus Saccharibacteria bacterium]|nr:hypothetical protein [Candidatus Saccharibacteria bacterium]